MKRGILEKNEQNNTTPVVSSLPHVMVEQVSLSYINFAFMFSELDSKLRPRD